MDKNAIINALRNYAQATSNELVNTVSGPIDLMNAGLGYVGLGTKEPIGGSAWMQRHGLTTPVPDGWAKTLGEFTGMALPIVVPMKAKEIATALNKMGENIAKLRGGGMGGGQRGAIVWHGSPHKFDKFDASKIGTGEGAQAYGHGLYLAESPSVAQQYADNVKDMGAAQRLNAKLSQLAKIMNADEVPGAYRKYRSDAGRKAAEEYAALMAQRDQVRTAPGNLYKVDLPDEHIAKMLDWDKPLSQQRENVRAAWESLSKDWGIPTNPNEMIGNIVNRSMLEQEMLKRGVPGIRYLDAGSRGAGAGTSNFVVFPNNENILNILERNGAPIPPQNLVKALRNGN